MESFKRDIIQFIVSETGLPQAEAAELIETPPDASRGDLAVPCFKMAKALRKNPAGIASDLAKAFAPTQLVESADAAGPYLNFRLARGPFFREVLEGPDAPTDDGAGKTIVLDYGSPNISKHLAYHHLRSISIGFSLKRIFDHLGYETVGINHLGDWGTTHGKLLAAFEKWGADVDLTEDGVTKLNRLYVRYNQEEDQSAGADWFRRLEEGEPAARELWEKFREVSLAEFANVFDLLGVSFDRVRGESYYADKAEAAIARVEAANLAEISDGAQVVMLSGPEDAHFGLPEEVPPFFLRKADGATVYGTRDLAAIFDRFEEFSFHRCIYVVGMGQALYFKQLFAVLSKMGLPFADRLEHVSFGVVRFDGKMTGSRLGNVVLLRDVLTEAVDRIRAIIDQKNPDLADRDEVARAVGVGALLFSDLSAKRVKDVEFVWENVLTFDGHTGPYVQYTHARAASILRKAGESRTDGDLSLLTHPEEWEVAKLLAGFVDRVRMAARDAEPSLISQYLLTLCETFSRYYNLGNENPELKVLAPDPAIRAARLKLVGGVRAVLARGLYLLGIQAPEEM
jgi:arginyl-tRNA synthetase